MRFRKSLLVGLVVLALAAAGAPALAEGSRDMFPNGATGNRANLWWTQRQIAGAVQRRTVLKAYLNAGEQMLMGSSGLGVGMSDIIVYAPGQVTGTVGQEVFGTAALDCELDVRQPAGLPNNIGRITSRAQELAGPNTINAGGYEPCVYTAPADGIYNIIMYGPSGPNVNDGGSGNVTGQISLADPDNFDATQQGTNAAWDVTVFDPGTGAAINGRLWTDYLVLSSGGNGRPVNSRIFTATLDGYIYRTDFRGLDPFGFTVYGNQLGFFDLDGTTPLYRNVLSTSGSAFTTLEGNVNLQRPQFPIFFNEPDNEALVALGIPTSPIAPTTSNLSFSGSIGGNTSLINAGGTFEFESNIAGVYELILSRDGVNFDPTLPANRVLRGTNTAGTNTITWDGLDNEGNAFPVGSYDMRLSVRAGEYHFPMLDTENSLQGGPTHTLLNPPNGTCPPLNGGCSAGFYDDRSYRIQDGTVVDGDPVNNDINVPLCGVNPPNPSVSDLLNGFDTRTNQRAFGTATGGNTNNPCTGSYGDVKGLDLWTYFPSNILFTPVIIVDMIPTDTPVPPPDTPVPPDTAVPPGTSVPPNDGGDPPDTGIADPPDPGATFTPVPGVVNTPTALPPPPTQTAIAILCATPGNAGCPLPPANPIDQVQMLPQTGQSPYAWLRGIVFGGAAFVLSIGAAALLERLARR